MPGYEVVARYADGRILRGKTWDFRADRPWFQLRPAGTPANPVSVSIDDLKAVFFVKSLDGNSLHAENLAFPEDVRTGLRTWVEFADGEAIAGWTEDEMTDLGFFVRPVDADSNNERVFVACRNIARVLHEEEAQQAARAWEASHKTASSVRRVAASGWREFLGEAPLPSKPYQRPTARRRRRPDSSDMFLQD